MLVLLLCIVMKIAEISVGRRSRPPPPPPPTCDRRCRRCSRYSSPSPKRRHRRQNRRISRKCKNATRLPPVNFNRIRQRDTFFFFFIAEKRTLQYIKINISMRAETKLFTLSKMGKFYGRLSNDRAIRANISRYEACNESIYLIRVRFMCQGIYCVNAADI